MSKRRLIFLEFNELVPSLLDKWMTAGLLPNFRRFYNNSSTFVTTADVEDGANLEPWIQWYSLHTGLSFDQHGVFHLTDGPRAGHLDIWSTLSNGGLRVANFSSMNCKGLAQDGSIFLPDPWCDTEKAYPPDLQIFQDFVQSQVQEYSNPNKPSTTALAAKFSMFLLRNGIRTETVIKTLQQLAEEKVAKRPVGWKRAVLLDWLQFDVFKHYFQKYQPDFSTFFLNSTAHFQHSYWREMEPEKFEVKPTEQNIERYQDAILFGYQNMDKLLAKFIELEKQGATLVLMTALSQQPFLKWESIQGQHFYRPKAVERLLEIANVRHTSLQPVMTHQYMVRFDNQNDREGAMTSLSAIKWDGKQVFQIDESEDDSIYVGCQIRTVVPTDAMLSLSSNSNSELPFYDIFYKIDATKSGCHHPDGVLWIKTGHHQRYERKVSILDIFPTTLDYFGIQNTSPDRLEMQGRSLMPLVENQTSVEPATESLSA